MKSKIPFQIFCIFPVIVFVFILTSGGCVHSQNIDDRLDLAEKFMESRPDSSLSILERIPDSDVKGASRKARYALLKSMALDKNFIDTTTFDVLQPAISYYLRKGSPDEMLRTYYYQGVIYSNAGNDELAMQAYLNALDVQGEILDSLTLARLLVAQSVLYYKEYRIKESVENNLMAGRIFGNLSKIPNQLNCYLRSLDGAIILDQRIMADSIMKECKILIRDTPSLQEQAVESSLRYEVSFGNKTEISKVIEEVHEYGLAEYMMMNIARAYSKIGEPETGLLYLNDANIAPDNILDSLTYWSVKTEILENMGEDKEALDAFRNYSRLLEVYHDKLFSNELLFSEKKHEMEIKSMAKLHKRDNAIKWILAGMLLLILVIGFIYYRYRLNKAAHRDAQQKAEKLQLEAEKLQLESANLQHEIDILEEEKYKLTGMLEQREELSAEMKAVIRSRLEMLNGLLAKEITSIDSYDKQFRDYVEILKKDKKKFLVSTRKAFQASHPEFIEYLKQHELTDNEINYACLYAIGLRGKEVGNYTELKRHYNISSDIRQKLGLDTNSSNLGPYIRKLMKEL